MCGILKTLNGTKESMIEHRGTETHAMRFKGYSHIHRTLPIQTTPGSKTFQQPIDIDGKGCLMFVGEIFNYDKGLYTCDVQMLIAEFTKYVNNASVGRTLPINDWDGFWAIVFTWYGGETIAFTDPLGKKQLYSNRQGEICSEIKPLVDSFEKFDPLYRSQVSKFGYNFGSSTPWIEVERLMPGYIYYFDPHGQFFNKRKYHFSWKLQNDLSLEELLFESIQQRLTNTKVPTALLVSGGFDSSVIAVMAKQLVDFKEDGVDQMPKLYSINGPEKEFVENLEEWTSIKVNYLDLPDSPSTEEFANILKFNESPIDLGSLIPQHQMLSQIEETVILTGDGADELFGGYKRSMRIDSQHSDIFDELTMYHLPRLDRAASRYTKELRNPFLSHDLVRYALALPWSERKDKNHLKKELGYLLPESILYREKLALKSDMVSRFPDTYLQVRLETFYGA